MQQMYAKSKCGDVFCVHKDILSVFQKRKE